MEYPHTTQLQRFQFDCRKHVRLHRTGQLQTVSVVRQDGASVAGSPTTTSRYDSDGNVTKIVCPNGTEADYDYSQLSNTSGGIETVSNNRSGTVLIRTFPSL